MVRNCILSHHRKLLRTSHTYSNFGWCKRGGLILTLLQTTAKEDYPRLMLALNNTMPHHRYGSLCTSHTLKPDTETIRCSLVQ